MAWPCYIKVACYGAATSLLSCLRPGYCLSQNSVLKTERFQNLRVELSGNLLVRILTDHQMKLLPAEWETGPFSTEVPGRFPHRELERQG
jgi:hypothetical protein